MTSKNTHKGVAKMNYAWPDQKYNPDRRETRNIANRVMKLVMVTHFARLQQLDELPTLQRNSVHERYHEGALHTVNKLPLSW